MEFAQSGLPAKQLVYDAYHIRRVALAEALEMSRQTAEGEKALFMSKVEQQFKKDLGAGRITQEIFQEGMMQSEEHADEKYQDNVEAFNNQLENTFYFGSLLGARLANDLGMADEKIAALLLRGAFRAPSDIQRVQRVCGIETLKYALEIWDIDAYPTRLKERLPKASQEVRELYLVSSIAFVEDLIARVGKYDFILSQGMEENLVEQVHLMSGTNPVLEQRFIESANKLGEINPGGSFSVRRDNDGALVYEDFAGPQGEPVDLKDIMKAVAKPSAKPKGLKPSM